MGSIQLKSVRKAFGPVNVINGVDLGIEDGEFAVFVGPSGCGKSTLLRLIAGLEDVTAGQILIDGKDVTNVGPAKRGLAMVFQSYALYPHMSVRGNIAFALKMAGQKRRRHRPEGAQGGGDAEPDRLSRPQAAPALRRPASAGRDRTGDRARAEGVPVRRAALQSRRGAARADAGRDRRTAQCAQDDDDLCHPRSGRGDDHGRQDRGARPRLGRAGRHAARALQQAERSLRRRLHRLADHEPDQGRRPRRSAALRPSASVPSMPTYRPPRASGRRRCALPSTSAPTPSSMRRPTASGRSRCASRARRR